MEPLHNLDLAANNILHDAFTIYRRSRLPTNDRPAREILFQAFQKILVSIAFLLSTIHASAQMTALPMWNKRYVAPSPCGNVSPQAQTNPNSGTGINVTVPANCFSMIVKIWGAGGGGGGGGDSSGSLGGFGGGGGYVTAALAVTPGETLSFQVGGGGIGGQHKSSYGVGDGGGGGGYSAIFRGGTVLAIAGGGGGGGGGDEADNNQGGNGGPGGGSIGTDGGNNGSVNSSGRGGGQSGPTLIPTGNQSSGTYPTQGQNFLGGNGGAADLEEIITSFGGYFHGGDPGRATAYGRAGGGGGGAGLYGGSGGLAASTSANIKGAGGGGGSSFPTASALSGSQRNPGNPSDSDRGGAGLGGTQGALATQNTTGKDGANGKIWYQFGN